MGSDSVEQMRPETCKFDIMGTEPFDIEEISGDEYPSLQDAQMSALPRVAELLASIVRQGIEDGRFVVVDGVVRVATGSECDGVDERGCTNGENVV